MGQEVLEKADQVSKAKAGLLLEPNSLELSEAVIA